MRTRLILSNSNYTHLNNDLVKKDYKDAYPKQTTDGFKTNNLHPYNNIPINSLIDPNTFISKSTKRYSLKTTKETNSGQNSSRSTKPYQATLNYSRNCITPSADKVSIQYSYDTRTGYDTNANILLNSNSSTKFKKTIAPQSFKSSSIRNN